MIVDPIYDNARLYRIRKETEDIKMEKKDIDWSNLSLATRKQITAMFLIIKMESGTMDSSQRIIQ